MIFTIHIYILELSYDEDINYIGCYRDYSQLHHMETLVAKAMMTRDICFHLCKRKGMPYAGLAAGWVFTTCVSVCTRLNIVLRFNARY